jgi:glycine cleavage system H lipoate-binding protein
VIRAFWKDTFAPGGFPAEIRFHGGHTWASLIGLELAFVGATEFAVGFAGALADITFPREQGLVRAGQVAWTLVSNRSRKLQQVSPLGGRILVANSYLVEHVAKLPRSPYHRGWILCLQSPSVPHELQQLLSHEAHQVSLDQTIRTMQDILGSSRNLPLQDGRWRPAFGDEFSDEEWEALRTELFPAPPSADG